MTERLSQSAGQANERMQMISHAERFIAAGDHKAALDVFLELAETEACEPADGIWGRIAACYRKLSMSEELHSLKNRLEAAGRPPVQVILQTALAHVDRKRPEEAIDLLGAARPGFPPDQQAEILRVWAGILSDEGRHDETISCIRSMFGLGTPHSDRQARFALALAERKRNRDELRMLGNAARLEAYWQDRRDSVYIHVCRELIRVMGRSASVVADIGSNRTPILDFFAHAPVKYSVDPGSPYVAHDVISVREDFFKWTPPKAIQIASCLQVMEHVQDVPAFAARLLEISEVALVSVPYMEPAGANAGHLHSEIDLGRITGWFGRPPNYHFIARELSGAERIICVFDTTTSSLWPTLCGHCAQGLRFRYRWSLKGSGM